jgi:type I restriction enzyme, S subunit
MKNGWQTKKLGDVCGFVRGPFGGSLKKSIFVEDGYAVYEQQHAIYDQFDEVRYFIDDAKFNEMQRFELRPNDLIMSCSGTMGRVAIVPNNIRRGIINQALLKLTPSNAVSSEFLKYWMDSSVFQVSLKAQSGGAAIQNVASVRILKGIQVALPEVPEQRRIVGILDEAFAGIATATAHAEQNLQNARALFESHLNAVFTQRDSSHIEKRLVDVCERITVGHVGSMAREYKQSGIPFLRSQNVRPFQISLDNVVYIDETFNQSLSKSQLKPGDLAVVRTGYPGTAAVIPETLPVSNCSDLVIVRPGPEVDAYYLAVFFNSSFGKALVAGRIVGAAQKHFNVTAAKQVAISFPPFAEQQRIVARIDIFREEIQRLESIYHRKLAALDELKKSLLHQAFSGQL